MLARYQPVPPFYSRVEYVVTREAHNLKQRMQTPPLLPIYQDVVPKAGDSAWNGDYVGSSPIVLTTLCC